MRALTKTKVFPLAILALFLLAACADEQPAVPEDQEVAEPMAQQEPAGEAVTKINLNTATDADFRTIPDVDDQMVDEFFEYRPYQSIVDFRDEMGKYVSEDQVAAYEEYVFVPIDPNESDAPTLEQLPGVDASEAAELVEGQPYASDQAFLDSLSSYVSESELAAARDYLATE